MQAASLQVQGVSVLLEGQGDATILMLHGWPDTCRLWDAQVEALKGQYRCARFTLPGFDVSQAPRALGLDAMVELIAQIAKSVSPNKPVILMLHDWGCFYGYQFAARHPERVERVIGVDIGDTTSKAFARTLRTKEKLLIAGYQLWLAAAYHLGSVGTRMSRWIANAMQCPVRMETLGAQQNYPYWHQWTGQFSGAKSFKPHCPMLYVYGKRKPFRFHSSAWEDALKARPDSRVKAFATGHWVMLGDPQGFNQEVLSWLNQQDAT
jgi:cis-3-alkyl-4-acyloxetan-2-one decarboxylase